MHQEHLRTTNVSRALKVGLPAAALGAGVIGVAAIAAGQGAAATNNNVITITEPSQLSPVDILMPPDKVKPTLSFNTSGLTTAEQNALKKPINVLAFTFGLGVAQTGGTGAVTKAPPASETFNFTKKAGNNDAALTTLVTAHQSVKALTLSVGSLKYLLSNVSLISFSRAGKTDTVAATFQKIVITDTTTGKGSTMVSSWNANNAAPITVGYNIAVNKGA